MKKRKKPLSRRRTSSGIGSVSSILAFITFVVTKNIKEFLFDDFPLQLLDLKNKSRVIGTLDSDKVRLISENVGEKRRGRNLSGIELIESMAR